MTRADTPFSSAAGLKFMGTLVVAEATALLSTIVYPGDIVLRINEHDLTGFSHSFDFETATNLITSTKPPRVIRILRPLGPEHTISPAEVGCFLGYSTTAMCKACSDVDETSPEIPKAIQPTAKFHVVVNSSNSSQSLQLMNLEAFFACDVFDEPDDRPRRPYEITPAREHEIVGVVERSPEVHGVLGPTHNRARFREGESACLWRSERNETPRVASARRRSHRCWTSIC